MYKKKARKKTYRKKRTFKKRTKRNFMQRAASSGIRMKYTTVFVPTYAATRESVSGTICLAGGKGTSPGDYRTLYDVNPDNKLSVDMDAYQQFSITGVSIKWIFAESITIETTPVQFSLAYSPNELINPALST